jgi:hypothetical protein
MDSDSSPPPQQPDDPRDPMRGPGGQHGRSGSGRAVTAVYEYDVKPQPFTFEHNREKRVFTLTGRDGKIQQFRDNPTRYLMVESDVENGAMRPVTEQGRPVIIYLCREEREV